jgi:hypothetical protein
MDDLATRIVYVQSAGAEEPFAWYQGEVLSAKQYAERAQIHQELNDIVKAATLDRNTQWGRTVRSHRRVLVEVRLSSLASAEAPLTATAVISGRPGRSGWAADAAASTAAILQAQGYQVDQERLAAAFSVARAARFWVLRFLSFLARAISGPKDRRRQAAVVRVRTSDDR